MRSAFKINNYIMNKKIILGYIGSCDIGKIASESLKKDNGIVILNNLEEKSINENNILPTEPISIIKTIKECPIFDKPKSKFHK